VAEAGPETGPGPVSGAPWGSASILPISWAYVALMGPDGLRRATEVAILNANYLAARLGEAYPILYRGEQGRVAHECILDLRELTRVSGVTVDDVAKRLIDFGFHAPTMSFPVAGTLMVEPTESESKAELDRFAEAMLAIRAEIAAIEAGDVRYEDSALAHAPHPAEDLMAAEWDRPYSREQAAYPGSGPRADKYWPPVSRIDGGYGDRNLMCSCPAPEAFAEQPA
jgi:glycine dehydrogenase